MKQLELEAISIEAAKADMDSICENMVRGSTAIFLIGYVALL